MPIQDIVKGLPADKAKLLIDRYNILPEDKKGKYLEKVKSIAAGEPGWMDTPKSTTPKLGRMDTPESNETKKSFVMKPSVFKKTVTTPNTTDRVEGYMTMVPPYTPVPPITTTPKKNTYVTGPEIINRRKEKAQGPTDMLTGKEFVSKIFKKLKSIPNTATGREGLNIIFNR